MGSGRSAFCGGTAGPAGSIDGLKSTLYNLTEMLHFEISAVELRATMHKVDALVKAPDGVMQATLNKVEALLDVSAKNPGPSRKNGIIVRPREIWPTRV